MVADVMAEQYVGLEIATYVIAAAIVLSGIIIGIGRAFGYKKLENFGVEEFFQTIVNAAIIGALAAIIELINQVASGIAEGCGTDKLIISQLVCQFTQINDAIFSLVKEMITLLNTIGYYQTLSLNFNIVTIQPFANLAAISSALSMQLLVLQAVLIAINMNITIMNFIGQNALGLILPIGLVFRTFFGTRRLGAFLIGLAIGLYLLYPSFIFIFPLPSDDIQNATAIINATNHKVYYSAVPVVELNDSNAIGAKLDVMSGRCFDSSSQECQQATQGLNRQDVDFVGDLGAILQKVNIATGRGLVYLAIAPLLSLIITAIFVKEITKIFGAELGLDFVKVV